MTTAVVTLAGQPKTFTITDAVAQTENVTEFNILIGTISGGPYPVTCKVSPADVATEEATGLVSVATANLSPVPTFQDGGTYYAVANAVNATGTSPNSPEFGFKVPLPLPSAPTSFTVA
jgi:hypothetical protein